MYPFITPRIHTGPGRKTAWTFYKRVRNSKYRPHQGARECARRARRLCA